MDVVQVVVAILEENAYRLGRIRLANDDRVGVAALLQRLPRGDPREAADPGEHLAELVRPLPGDRKRADPAAAQPGDGAACGIMAQLGGLLHLRQDLFQQEPRILVGERVVLEAAVARSGPRAARRESAWLEEDPDGH